VVMVALAAKPVAGLERVVRERVDDPVLGESAQRSVDGREADSVPLFAQTAVELLRGHVVRLARELLEHAEPLPRHAEAGVGDAVEQSRLTRIAHYAYASS